MPDTDPPDQPRPKGPEANRRMRFEAAGALVGRTIRKAGEVRGFAVTRVLTDWAELAGPELARLCRPVRVSYGRGSLGATLVIETPGAAAPLVQSRLDGLKARINAAYGYAAIARIQLQHGGLAVLDGMAEATTPFAGAPVAGRGSYRSDNLANPSDRALAQARALAGALTDGVADEGLKAALDRLAVNVLGRGALAAPGAANEGKDGQA
jgi:hypothetical protein